MTTTWGQPPAVSGISPEKQSLLDELDARRTRGELTAFEHGALRKAILAAPPPRAAPPTPGPSPDAAPAVASPAASAPAGSTSAAAEPEKKKDPVLPASWAAQTDAHKAPKSWGSGKRGDDPTVRTIHKPTGTGVGDGKSFLFLFGFRVHNKRDQEFLQMELRNIDDDITQLCAHGYTVAVDPQCTNKDFTDAVAGNGEGVEGLIPEGLFFSAHGEQDGSVQASDGGTIKPKDVDPATVSPGLKLVAFAACYVGSRSKLWRDQLGGKPLVVGWGQPVTIDRAVEFLQRRDDSETDLDDLIDRYLLKGLPVPQDPASPYSPVSDAASRGRAGDIPSRVASVAHHLGAQWREQPTYVELDVPVQSGRRHIAKVFLVDSNLPFSEGEPLLGVEAEVGELTTIADVQQLYAGLGEPGFSRIMVVKGTTDVPRLVVQAFMPVARCRDRDVAAIVYQVCAHADTLENRIFGGDRV